MYDFNARGYLEAVDLHFIAFNVITVIIKLFGIESHLPQTSGSVGELAFNEFQRIVKLAFKEGEKILIQNLLLFASNTKGVTELFGFCEVKTETVTNK